MAEELLVHLLWEPAADAVGHLRERLDARVRITVGADLESPPGCRVLVGGSPRREHLEGAPDADLFVVPWAGLPKGVRDLAREFPRFAVHNLHHNAAGTAETAVALMLAAAKFLVPMDRALRAHDWGPRYEPSPSIVLEDRTALVLGYGAIGRRVARACRGLGMPVLATRRSQEREVTGDDGVQIQPASELRWLLHLAGVLIVTLPLTDETEGLIGAEEIALLPDNAILVNVGRGLLVDEEALYEALRDGRLAAAGLDVWYEYPKEKEDRQATPPSRFAFHELDNVVMSPHRAGSAHDNDLRRMGALAELLNAVALGEPVPNRVDVEAGY